MFLKDTSLYKLLHKRLKKMISPFRYKNEVRSFENMLHDDRPVYVKEGYGGKNLTYYPPFKFFALYLKGSEKEAFQHYVDWYKNQLSKYLSIEKSKGGMKNGSLHRLIKKEHIKQGIQINKQLENANPEIVENSIRLRVAQRFTLLESIRITGYHRTDDPIPGKYIDPQKVILHGGHHRCSILKALGVNQLMINIKLF